MKNLIHQICGFINHAIQDVCHFINRLAKPDIDLWLNILLPFIIGSATLLCGGYAIKLLPFVTPFTSVISLAAETIIIFIGLRLIYNSVPAEDKGPFEIIMAIFGVVVMCLVAFTVCLLHFWWPKTAAGAGAAINLFVIILIIADNFRERKEKLAAPDGQPA